MESDKSINRRRKSIMVIDKKGKAKELAKEDASVSKLIDSTDKTLKDRIISPKQDLDSQDLKDQKLSNHDLKDQKLSDHDLSNQKLSNHDLSNKTEDIPNKTNNPFIMADRDMSKNSNIGNVSKNDNIGNVSKNDNIGNVSKNDNIGNVSKNSNLSHDTIKKEDMSNSSTHTEKKTLNMRNAEIAAGATAGAAAGIILGKSKDEEDIINNEDPNNKEDIINNKAEKDDKHVSIDENQNEEHSVDVGGREIPLTDEERSDIKAKSPLFIPQRIPNHDLPEGEIKQERENDNVEAEGHMWKRRRIFACFWHEKYFLLTKDGFLKYHKANGTKKSKGNWDLRKFSRIHEVFMGGEHHPFRLALMNDDENLLFGFDDSDNREYWLTKLSKFINN